MLYFPELNVGFYMIPKTGCNSLLRVKELQPYMDVRQKAVYLWPTRKIANVIMFALGQYKNGPGFVIGLPCHATADQVAKWMGFGRFRQVQKIAIVRNPYDWLQSLYRYVRKDAGHYYHAIAQQGFIAFATALLDDSSEKIQSDYVCIRYRAFVEHIVHQERMNEEMRIACEACGVPLFEMPHANRTDRSQEIIWSPEILKKYRKYAAKDFVLFGYNIKDTCMIRVE